MSLFAPIEHGGDPADISLFDRVTALGRAWQEQDGFLDVPLRGAGVGHGTAAGQAANQPLLQRSVFVSNGSSTGMAVPLEEGLHPVKQVRRHDPRVFTLMNFLLVPDRSSLRSHPPMDIVACGE